VAYDLATPEDLGETERLVKEIGRRIVAIRADVRSADEMSDALKRGVSELGRLDIVIANAGILGVGENGVTGWDDIIDVNLKGVWNTVRAAEPYLVAQGEGGSMVLTSSSAGLKSLDPGEPALDAYTASKHGVVGLMRQLAKRLGPHNIRVNSIHPTGVNTMMINNEPMQKRLAEIGIGLDGAAMGNLLPVFAVEPEDISEAILWLVSDAAKWVTGVTLPIDAGLTMR
jgi:NAD(P)-dependent dehydrogenase (short-subunit alcohol dehydrogenase family)